MTAIGMSSKVVVELPRVRALPAELALECSSSGLRLFVPVPGGTSQNGSGRHYGLMLDWLATAMAMPGRVSGEEVGEVVVGEATAKFSKRKRQLVIRAPML